MRTLTVSDEDYTRAKQLLIRNGIPIELEVEKPIPFLRKSDAKADETPVSFGGIWTNDERTLASIRAKAWPKRN